MKLARIISSTLLALVACSTPAPKEAPPPPVRTPVAEDINDRFLDPALDPAQWVSRWEVESREIYASRHEVTAAIGLGIGDKIADVGAGTGLFMEPFSRAVGPEGKVYEVDISPGFVLALRRRVVDDGFANVEVVLSSDTSTRLEDGSVDAVFVCDTYHHFEFHTSMLASIHSALKPGGKLIVIDFERIPGVSREWTLGHVRADKQTFTAEIEESGFRLVEEVEIPGFEENYFLRFTRE